MVNPYDRIADAFEAARDGFEERRFVDALLETLPTPSRILDLGCGTGTPITRYLLDRGHRVTGVDLSAEMLRRARRNVPDAHLLRGDIATVSFPPASYHAVVAWDSIFHVPRAEHEDVYRRCHGWLRPGGRLLLSCGGSEWEGTSEMLGEEFFYSGLDPLDARALLEMIGFRVERWEVDDPSSRGHIAAIVTRT